MDQKWKESMKASISEVLSTMFYSPVEFEQDTSMEEIEAFFSSEDVVVCKIEISAEVVIKIFAGVSSSALDEMSIDFTGKEEITKEDSEGTFKEMLNMICGGALADTFGNSEFKLGIPQIVEPGFVKKDLKGDLKTKIILKGNLLNGEIGVVTL